MAQLIAAIRNAEDAATAVTNYSQARSLDKNNVELYDTYMKKMLTLGYPRIAVYPAMVLIRLQPKNGTAWGVVGYNDAKQGRYLTAFMSTIRGLQLLPDDPAIQYNAGALTAWYETLSVKPTLSGSFKALLAQQSQQWLEKAKFAEGHRKGKSEFSGWAERIERLKADIAPAETAAKAAALESSEATDTYRQYGLAIARLKDDVKVLARLLNNEDRDLRRNTDYYRRRRTRTIIALRERIRDKQGKISALKNNRERVRKEMVEKAGLLKDAEQALAKAGTALWTEKKTLPLLAWLPPAVDGVITPEAKSPPILAADTQPATGPAPEVQLEMAKLLLQNNRKHKAMAILEVIVKKYPDTKAAKQAAELLKVLKRTGLEQI